MDTIFDLSHKIEKKGQVVERVITEPDDQQLTQEQRRQLEEISLLPEHYSIRERHGPYRYLYGEGRKKKGYHGKEQHYFLVDLLGLPSCINVATVHPEFRAHRWIAPADFRLEWLPAMKREVYRAVLEHFFGLKLK